MSLRPSTKRKDYKQKQQNKQLIERTRFGHFDQKGYRRIQRQGKTKKNSITTKIQPEYSLVRRKTHRTTSRLLTRL